MRDWVNAAVPGFVEEVLVLKSGCFVLVRVCLDSLRGGQQISYSGKRLSSHNDLSNLFLFFCHFS